MKYRTIGELRTSIRTMRDEGRKWRELCEHLHILTEDGKPNTGLAKDIGYLNTVNIHGDTVPYEPVDLKVRKRLGLRNICPHCRRPFRKKEAKPRKYYRNYKKALSRILDAYGDNDGEKVGEELHESIMDALGLFGKD